MFRMLIATCAVLVLAACTPDTTGLDTLTVPELATLLTADAAVTVCDANNADTRAEYGVIPGAILLTSYKDFSTAELPPDKGAKLVFYCSNELCSAAPKAAQKAAAAGYSDVNVLTAGIKGWVEAEQPVEQSQAG